MKHGIFLVLLLTNIVALFCTFNPWFEDWSGQGIVFLLVEALFLLFLGLPVLVYHLRKGLSFREALEASLQTMLDFLAGWV